MRAMVKFKWLVLAAWLAAVVGLALTAPNMADLVREKGQISVPDGYSSTNASKWISEMSAQSKEGQRGDATVLVFSGKEKLNADHLAEIQRGIGELKAQQEKLGISSITTHFDTPDLAKQMVSEDGKTVLVLLSVDAHGKETSDALYKAIADVKVDHYLTGNWLIQEDVIQSSEEGLKKTEYITVAFILAILFLVFRSAIAPFIPLLTVGISYVAAQSVVSYLVKYLDFPLSNFTQIFMVAVMFGIGTDYCILLISRFKEELAHNGGDKVKAILDTYRTAGKTVLFSGLAVLVGFASIGFSTFGLYRSAVAVAVGVAVLMLALVTLVPFFMAALGSVIFWPARGSLEHKPSGFWGAAGSFSLRKPLWALVLLAVILVPFLSFYKGTTSFNSLDEIGDKYNSVRGFNLISDSFGPGESLPTTVVMKTDKALDTSEGLAMIEQVSRELSKVDGVKAIRSATRPTGEAPADFQVASQVDTLGNGLNQGTDGIDQVAKGLSDASKSLESNASKISGAAAGADKLAVGTQALKQGVVQLGDGLKRIEKGLRDGSVGAKQLSDGLAQAKASADRLTAASKQLLDSYKQMDSGLGQLAAAYADLAKQQQGLTQGLADLGQGLGGLAEKYPELKQDADFLRAQGSLTQLQTGSAQLGEGLKQLNDKLAGVNQGLSQANAGFGQAADGQAKLAQGLAKLSAGIADLQAGIAQAADGQGQVISKLPSMTSGFDKLASGQQEIGSGFAQLNGQLGQLTDGLNQSVDGLTKVAGGLKSAQGYIGELTATPDKQLSGWFIPEEAIRDAEFQKALDVYLSPDRKIVKFDVVFAGNPYASETMAKMPDVEAAVGRALKGTGYEQASVAVGGVTSINHDLKTISSGDYARTVVLMLVGIGLILILLFRSFVIPIYLILSLLGTYYTSLAINELIFVRILGYSGASWTVPFFGFVLLLALGVDYSIFLMDRFKEYRHLPPREAILKAMKNMGTVILSAAVILGGTFAAMLPSGVMSLLQIATIVLSGLFLYAVVVLPLFIPVMVRTFGEANWWPFMGRQRAPHDGESESHPSAPTARPAHDN
ncbi:MMPL family transporter [Cohnella nanjingensis]|uniref:MMPL family transporter n=1 Tax=Cohnella nanjingensis TaxID=1387779 RepID=A0A7X0VDD2_9BACL|nr:MMPL family transporter [Cohnella nanjingensis]MBB6669862.1 MMPL family transporter [Cohnella nanjingensis]